MMTPVFQNVGRKRRALMRWPGLLLAGVIAVGLAQLVPWTRSADRETAAPRPDCSAWDRAASEGVAALIFETGAAAELRLDEAILQLRRARKNCRSGAIDLAGHDYRSLHQAFPVFTGSIGTASHGDAMPAQAATPRR